MNVIFIVASDHIIIMCTTLQKVNKERAKKKESLKKTTKKTP